MHKSLLHSRWIKQQLSAKLQMTVAERTHSFFHSASGNVNLMLTGFMSLAACQSCMVFVIACDIHEFIIILSGDLVNHTACVCRQLSSSRALKVAMLSLMHLAIFFLALPDLCRNIKTYAVRWCMRGTITGWCFTINWNRFISCNKHKLLTIAQWDETLLLIWKLSY